jgi:AmiR/NasT family two-component response regulator
MSVTEIEALAADSVGEELAQAHSKIANLEIALASSRRIGMAIGILMARFTIGDDAAFEMLRTASQRQNRKLRDIAEDVVLAGTLD